MEITKQQTETYILTELEKLDPVTAYVTNYGDGKGKIVIECYGEAWANYWGGMSGLTVEGFILSCDNDYLINKFLQNIHETDFDKISEDAKKKGFYISATNDVELAMQESEMRRCFGDDWYMDLPTRTTSDYHYLSRILDALKTAFKDVATPHKTDRPNEQEE